MEAFLCDSGISELRVMGATDPPKASLSVMIARPFLLPLFGPPNQVFLHFGTQHLIIVIDLEYVLQPGGGLPFPEGNHL